MKRHHATPLVVVGLVGLGVWWVWRMIQFKDGVNKTGVQPQTWFGLGAAATVARWLGADGITVTSLTDSVHGSGSLHPGGFAADIRTRDWQPDFVAQFFSRVRELLGKFGFDVVLEKDHLHMEYDPKAGRSLF